MWNHARRRRVSVGAALTIALALAVGSSTRADDKKWVLQLEPMHMQAYGHDPHVLTINEIDTGPPQLDSKTAVKLETETGFAFRGEFQYDIGQWAWGVGLFSFMTSQSADSITASADGPSGTIDEVVFQVADRQFNSTNPGDVLFYQVLEDTDLATWTFDLYGMRTLGEKPESGIHLQFGLRFGDFDNDYRAALGVQGGVGARLDASSNHERMMGPLVGLAGDVRFGKNQIRGYIGQSVLVGDVELTSRSRDFTGPVGMPSFGNQETFRQLQEVAIPVTEFRIKWSYRVSKKVALGAGANTSVWWDVPVPPGVIPTQGGDEILHENTIVFLGLLGSVELTF